MKLVVAKYLNRIIKSNDSRTLSVKRNIIASFFIRGLSIIISLTLVPLTLGFVTSELYGIWLTLSSIVVWMNFFDIGFNLGLKNKLTEALALSDYSKGKMLVSTTYIILAVIFIPLCIILELTIPNIDWAKFLNVDSVYNQDIVKAMHILVACFCSQMIVNVLVSVASAYQKVALSALFPVIGNAIAILVIYILTIYTTSSLFLLALAISICPVLVTTIFSFILYNTIFKQVSPSLKFFRLKIVKEIFGLSLKFFLIQIQVVVLFQTTNILISNVSNPESVSAYNIAYKYLNVSMMLYTIILSPLWPAFTDAYTKSDYNWMKLIYSKMTKLFGLSALIMILMIVCSNIVYAVWLGDKIEIPYIMTISVGVYMLLATWNSLQVNLINGIGKVKLQSYITFIGLLLHIPLSLLFGKYFAALGVVFSMCIITIIYVTIFTIQLNRLLRNEAKGIWNK